MARYLRQLTLAAGTLIGLATTASAGINTWTSVGPEGGDVVDLKMTNTSPAVAYALTWQALFRSNDAGRSWARVGRKFEQTLDIAVHPTQTNRVIVIADRDVLASTDGGATYARLTPPAANELIEVEFSRDGTLLYAADGHALYRSSDFGATWTAGAPMNVGGFKIDSANANRVIAVNQMGIQITTDAGDHWTSIASPPVTTVLDFELSPSSPRVWAATSEGLWYTTDAGVNWTQASLAAPTDVFTAVSVDPVDASIVYAQSYSSVYRSIDGGATWTRGTGTYGLWTVKAFAFDPQNHARVLIGTPNGVWASEDSGANWSRSNSSMLAVTTSRFTSTPDRTYFVARGEIHTVASGADTATLIDPLPMSEVLPFRPAEFLYGLHASRVSTGDRLFVGDAGVARSLDGGRTWVRLTDPLVNRGGFNALDVAPDNSDVVLMATYNGVLRSIDGGDHWSTTSGISDGIQLEKLAFISPSVVLGTSILNMYRSTDAGVTWSQTGMTFSNERVLSLFVHDNVTYLGLETGVYRSPDGGVSWTRMSPAHGGSFTADATGVYLAGFGVERSVDGGNTWVDIGKPLGVDITGVTMDPGVRGRVLLSTWYAGVQTLTIATDLEVTATGQPTVAPGTGVRTEMLITVTNRGPHAATGVKLDINVAGGRTLFENSDCTVNASARSQATCSIAPLGSGQSKVVRIESSFETAGPLTLTATATANETELTANNNISSNSWTYVEAKLSPRSSGGGGAFAWWMLLALAGLAAERKRVACHRH